jgi:CubicO group peptidase (beta-lactamase class C family)
MKTSPAMKRILPLFACFTLLFAADSHAVIDPAAAGMSADRLSRIPARMQEFVNAGTAAGFVTLVARHGHVALLSAVGYQDLETKAPMKPDTLFRIMSMTKPMTAAAVMMMVEEGRLSLIDPVEKYLPEYRGQKVKKCADAASAECLGKPSHPITIFDVLSHTSGIQEPPKGSHTLGEAVAASAKLPLEFDPGTTWRYRTAGINVAGRIVEVVSGMSYEDFMATRLFQPLGMRDTTFFPPVSNAGRIATVYTAQNGSLKLAPMTLPKPGETFAEPGAGAFSTAEDMAHFYQMVLSGGTYNGKHFLSPASIQMMTTPQTGDLAVGFAPGLAYGLGWGVVKDPKGMFRLSSIGSFGHGGAYRTYGWVDPAKDMFSVIMMQRTNEGGDIADEINAFLAMAAAAIEH